MKKVLYISYDGMTDQLGQSQVIPYVAGLSKMGYEFTIISFEKKEKYITTGPLIQSLLEKNGIKWHPEIFSRNPPILAKIYDIWKMNRAIRKLHKEQKFSFTHCRSYVPASAGLRLFKRSNIPFLFDMRGFWVDERIDNGQWDLKKPLYRFFYNYYKKKENLLFRKSVHIISLTWKGKDELVTKFGINPEKITVIPCCVDLKLFDFNKISR
ncbi:MAG: glycosyltransferase family 4 protein, partial [Bacteroidota bacterium]